MKNILKRLYIKRPKNLKDIFQVYLKRIYKYFNSDLLFFYFLIGALINTTLVRFLTVKNYFEYKPILGDFTILVIIGALSYLVKAKGRFTYFVIWSWIITLLCFINSVYYTFYSSFVSVSLISTSIFVLEVGDAVVQNVLNPLDAIYFVYPVVYYVVGRKKMRQKEYYRESKRNTYTRMLNTFMLGAALTTFFLINLTPLELGRLNKQWNREFLVSKFGLQTYHINDLIKSIQPKINSLFGYDQAVKLVKDFYEERQQITPTKNKYTDIFKGRNIIAIHAESIQSFAMNLKFNGLEVTPNLSALANEGIHFTNFYTQVSVGTSSDTEFTINTSLLPVSNGTVFVSYWNREFVTIPKLLSELGYYCFSMHGNNGTFWNRLVMHKEMGYHKFFHKTSFEIDETIGLGLSDKSFFRQAVPIINDIKTTENKPFYATLIMLTNHTPFDEIEKYGDFPVDYKTTITNSYGLSEEVSYPYMEDTIMGRYLKSVHYADEAIGQFINDLDQAGLLENSVVIIYGDHDARLPRKDYERLYNYDYVIDDIMDENDPRYKKVDYYQYELDRKVPFIIWTKDKKFKKKVDTVMGMYDVLPTLGNMFGFYNEYPLGHDIFSVKENVVVFPNSNWVTNKVYYNSQKEEYMLLKEEPLPENYIATYNEYADKILEVSNSIILYDLIRKERTEDAFVEEIIR